MLLREYCTTFVLKSATYGTDNNDPITENKRLDKDNYVDAKSLKMCFKPARLFVPFACSGRHGTFRSNLALSCSMLFSNISTNYHAAPVRNPVIGYVLVRRIGCIKPITFQDIAHVTLLFEAVCKMAVVLVSRLFVHSNIHLILYLIPGQSIESQCL